MGRYHTIKPAGWWPNIDACIADGTIPVFGTQRDAIEKSHSVGWGNRIIKVERRFENVYIIGTIDLHTETIAGVDNQIMRVPLCRYEKGDDGIEYQPVVKFKKPISHSD